MLKRNKLRGCSLRALRNQSKPLDNVAVTLTEQHFDRASESRAEIFPVAAYTSIGTWRTMAREAATRHSSCCDFGSRAAVRCTLICPRYLLRVMSPEDQRSVYICDNTLIGWCVDSAVPHTTCKKDKKNKAVWSLRTAALESWLLIAFKLTQHSVNDLRGLSSAGIQGQVWASLSLPLWLMVDLHPTCFWPVTAATSFYHGQLAQVPREQQHACCCNVTEHELIAEFRPLTLASCTLGLVCQGFTFLAQSLQQGVLTLAPRAKWVLAWVSAALLAARLL